MTDTDDQEQDAPLGSDASDEATETATAEPPAKKLNLAVEIQDIAQCRKRVKVTVPPEDIADAFNEQFTELVENAAVPGFRPGHAPRRLIERKFRKEVAEQVKGKLLMRSLEQVGEEQEIYAISEPKLDVTKIELPETGPLVYEFEVEVSPEFELPEYKGLKIKRPVKEFGEADVNKQLARFLEQYGQIVPISEPAAVGDYIIADVVFRDGPNEISRSDELTVRIQKVLRFRDGTIERFDKAMVGVTPGTTRTVPVVISAEAPNVALRGRTIEAEFAIKDLKRMRLPVVDAEFLEKVGYTTEEQLRDALHSVLRRRLEFEQRRTARQQMLQQLTGKAQIELPPDLVRRQVQSTLRRRVMEMHDAGFSDDEIRRRQVELHQRSHSATEQYLREHFLLAKIAEKEEIEVKPEDIDNQVQVMALQSDESPRRVRARLQKEGLLDVLEIQILEQLAADRVLEYATYVDVPLEEEEEAAEAVDQAAAAGEETAEEQQPAEQPQSA
jgi:trigger factor